VATHRGNQVLRLGVLQPGFGVRVLEIEVVDRPVQGIIERCLELAALAFCIWRSAASISGAAWKENFSRTAVVTAISNMIYPDDS
jgi:hypothetical protein